MAALDFMPMFLVIVILFFGPTILIKPAEAGKKGLLIEQACHTAEVPDVCKQCLESDKHSAKADAVGIAGIIIGCLISHSSYLASNMSHLASNPQLKYNTKSAYQHCFLHCSDAKKALNAAASELNNGRYDRAELSLREAALDQGSCRYEFLTLNQTYVPPNVNFDLNVFDILTLTAFRIIEKL